MNAQAILQKIEDDALQAAAQAKAEAEKKAAGMKEDSRAKVEAMRDETVRQAEAESQALAGRMRRMAELDMRKLLLQSKREVMDVAFEQAKAELCQMPAKEARAFLLRQTAAVAQGDEELIVGANNAGWFDESFLGDLNAALRQAGKAGDIKRSPCRREGVTGVILSRAGTEVFVTFEAMLGNVRADLETEIARILFNE